MKFLSRNFTGTLIYLAVLARAVGWAYAQGPIQPIIWVVLGIYGVMLISEAPLRRSFPGYPRLYILLQAGLVIFLLYSAPRLDFLPLLFFPLSFQAVEAFGPRIGFACIAVFTFAMAGMFFFGLEWGPGLLMILLSGTSNGLMGSYAHLMARTEKRQQENQRLYSKLQGTYWQLKDHASQQEQLAAAQERHRLVRELHDSLTQTLFSMNLAVQSAQIAAREVPEQTDEHLVRLQALAANASREIKGFMSQAISRPQLAKGLAKALGELVEQCRLRDGLQVSLEISGGRRMPETVEANLFRIAQEALNNVVRHAGVRQAWVKLYLKESPAHLEIHDAGCGFETALVNRGKGFGLTGMVERAAEIGWALEVDSHPGEGTHVTVQENLP